MNPTNQPPAKLDRKVEKRLRELLNSLTNGALSDEQQQELESILIDNPPAQRFYQQFMMVHAELYWLHDSLKNPQVVLEGEEETVARRWFDASRVRQWLTLAAMLLVGLTLGWLLNSEMNTTERQVVEYKRVATLTGTLNCRWEGEDRPNGYGTSLFAGQKLRLKEGIAEITFENGAQIILQSPAELDLDSFRESHLHSGKLTANCPPSSTGLRVNTSGLMLVDRGTEFGVMTDGNGNTEVHVFDGVVEGHYLEERGRFRKVEWRQSDTAQYTRASARIQSLAKPNSTYVRSLSVGMGPMNGVLAADDFDYPLGPLGGQNGGFGWGGAWRDIEVEEGDLYSNQIAAGSIGGRSASGNHALIGGNFNRIRRELSTSYNGVFDAAGYVEVRDGVRVIGKDETTLYLSFSQKIDRLDQVFYGFELNRGDGNQNRVLCIGHAAAKSWTEGTVRTPDKEAGVTGWAVTSEFNGSDGLLKEFGSLGPETTDEVFFVLKLTFGKDHVDQFELFMNPASMWDEEQCIPVLKGSGDFAFDRIGLANFEGDKEFHVDRIKVGKTFSSVTRPMWTGRRVQKEVSY